MKKIQINSCEECLYCAQYDNGLATCNHPQLYIEIDRGITQAVEAPTDGTIHPDCPLEDDLPESNGSNWIPVSQRLPERKKQVLLYGEREFSNIPEILQGWLENNTPFFCSSLLGDEEYFNVTYWQHLPIPPQDIDKTIT
jgi:hypothetical protein